MTGSHNLGWRASHNNDENFVIVHGHRPLAEAYACHVLDVYDHYAWRWWLAKEPATFGKPLDGTDAWQDRYIKDGETKSAEMKFWLEASASVVAHATADPTGERQKASDGPSHPAARRQPTRATRPPRGHN